MSLFFPDRYDNPELQIFVMSDYLLYVLIALPCQRTEVWWCSISQQVGSTSGQATFRTMTKGKVRSGWASQKSPWVDDRRIEHELWYLWIKIAFFFYLLFVLLKWDLTSAQFNCLSEMAIIRKLKPAILTPKTNFVVF